MRFIFPDPQEYCIREQFQAECQENKIILLTGARYGRMRTGRCISEEYGHIGCFADVTNYIDGLCSGRHSCDVTVRKLLDIAQPCPDDLTCYLEADYDCVSGRCSSPPPLNYYHPRMRVGNVFSRICLSVHLSVHPSFCVYVCSGYNFWTPSHINFIFGIQIHLYHI